MAVRPLRAPTPDVEKPRPASTPVRTRPQWSRRTEGDAHGQVPASQVFNEGYSGEVDFADEAIRQTRQVRSMTDDEEASGLLALTLLHHARRAARTTPDGTLVQLTEQDRSRWDTELIAEGVAILQAALARDRLGEYQVQAAIAALHADAQRVDETDWVRNRGVVRRARP